MALIRANGTRTASGPNRMFSGVTTVAGAHRFENIAIPHTHLNFASGWHSVANVTDRSSVPQGARHPVAYKWARKTGGLASHNECTVAFALAASGALGRNIEAATSITFAAPDAQLQLVVSASGSVTITFTPGANLAGALSASGATSFTFAAPDALLGAIAGLSATAGVAFGSASTVTAIGHLAGDITPYTELSPQSLAAAVWNAVATEFNLAGSMGALMNGGAAGGLTTEQATQLLEIFQRLGLDVTRPLTQTATEISTDDWSLTVTEGVGTVTVERQ